MFGRRPEVFFLPLSTPFFHPKKRACEGEKQNESMEQERNSDGITERHVAEEEGEQKHQSEKKTTVDGTAKRGSGTVNPSRNHAADKGSQKRNQERNGLNGRVGVGQEVDCKRRDKQ